MRSNVILRPSFYLVKGYQIFLISIQNLELSITIYWLPVTVNNVFNCCDQTYALFKNQIIQFFSIVSLNIWISVKSQILTLILSYHLRSVTKSIKNYLRESELETYFLKMFGLIFSLIIFDNFSKKKNDQNKRCFNDNPFSQIKRKYFTFF